MEQALGVISQNTLDSLRCSICQNFLTVAPIVITSKDGSEYKCGRCSFVETDFNIPAVMYETLAATMKFPCIYERCGTEIEWKSVKLHEDSCMYQLVKCPCGETIELHEAQAHFIENHPDIVSEDQAIVESPGFSQFHTRFILRDKVPFLVYVLCEKKVDIKVGVYALQSTNKTFDFKLEISTNSNMSKISIPGRKIVKFNTREHCSDCLLRTCGLLYHKYQNGANHPVSEMTSANVNTSSVFKILNSEDFIISITVYETNLVKESMRRSWECQICNEYFTGMIFVCITGHSLCGNCRFKLSLCPYCKNQIGNSRNFALESMAEQVQLTCQNEVKGCCFVGNVKKIAQHEKECKREVEPLRKKLRIHSIHNSIL